MSVQIAVQYGKFKVSIKVPTEILVTILFLLV